MTTVAVVLLGGLGSDLARLGWQMAALSQLIHGRLMICGFWGMLICLEGAVTLVSHYCWRMIVPLINAAGAIGLLLIRDAVLAKFFLTAGSLGFLVLCALMWRLYLSRGMVIMASGAACWLVGRLAGQPIYQVVHL